MAVQVVGGEPRVAELDGAGRSVSNDMDRVDVVVLGQHFADLLDPVAVGVEHDDFDMFPAIGAGQRVVDQLRNIRHSRINEHQLPPRPRIVGDRIGCGVCKTRWSGRISKSAPSCAAARPCAASSCDTGSIHCSVSPVPSTNSPAASKPPNSWLSPVPAISSAPPSGPPSAPPNSARSRSRIGGSRIVIVRAVRVDQLRHIDWSGVEQQPVFQHGHVQGASGTRARGRDRLRRTVLFGGSLSSGNKFEQAVEHGRGSRQSRSVTKSLVHRDLRASRAGGGTACPPARMIHQPQGASPMPLTLQPDGVSRKAASRGFSLGKRAGLHRRLAPCRSK